MKLVIGLGNPGPEYADTRHNAGFHVVDALAARGRVEVDCERFAARYREFALSVGADGSPLRVALLQPRTFMNRSGESVAPARVRLGGAPGLTLPAQDCLVVYDDLDLDFGRIRLRASGGAGGHNGIASVIEVLGTRDVPRLRFGISRPAVGSDPIQYVLGAFTASEQHALPPHLERAADAVLCWIRHGIAEAMSTYNAEAPGLGPSSAE